MEAVKEVALNTHPNIVPQVKNFVNPAMFRFFLLEEIVLNYCNTFSLFLPKGTFKSLIQKIAARQFQLEIAIKSCQIVRFCSKIATEK